VGVLTPDPSRWDDETLALRCAVRDDAAWQELLRRVGSAVEAALRRAFARAGAPDPAREAAEAMGDWASALLERDGALLRAHRPGTPLVAYLAVVARTVAFRIMRKRRPRLSLDVEAPGGTPWRDLLESPSEQGEGDLPARVAKAMERLPARDSLILRLLYWEGLSYGEAAPVLGVSPESLGPLASRARKALREALGGK
jgi:RNA polymerase sigma-70 factor (ECF subfamily)